jgi:hypothetical protein
MMDILTAEQFFERCGTPDTWNPMICGGVVTNETTVDELRERGFSEAAIVEVEAFRDWLALPTPRPMAFDRFLANRRLRTETDDA